MESISPQNASNKQAFERSGAMSDVYKRLAQKLDGLPNGFPATESGVELKILKHIFAPDEAEIFLKLSPVPETVETIAERLGEPIGEMQATLDDMVLKGQVEPLKKDGKQMYKVVPFAVGLYEFYFLRTDQTERQQKEFMKLFEEYLPHFGMYLAGFEPPYFRVVPVSTEIKADLQVHRYDDIRRMLEESKSFQLQDCMCRREKAFLGDPCKYPLDVCLNFSNEENAYERYPQLGRAISKVEAFKVIERAEEEGLVHLTYNVEEGQHFMCACCPCCCGMLRAVKEFNLPTALAKSDFVAAIDQESCTGCGVCKDERCPMDAIVEENDEYRVIEERCIGCGACAPSCPTEAIALVQKPESERTKPPADTTEWNRIRAAARGIEADLE